KWPSPAKGSFEHRLEQALEEQLAVVEKSGLELFERSIIDELSDARCIKTDKCAEQEYEKAYNLYRSITGVYGIRKVWVSDEEYYHWMTSGVRRIRDEGYVRKLLEQAKRYDRAIYYLMLGAADVLKPEVFEWMRQKYAQKRYDVDHGVMLISLAALGEGSNAWADLLASRLVKYQRPEVSTAIFRALANTGHCQVLKDRGVPYLKDFLENYRESGDIFSVGYVGVKMLNRCRADISELLVHAEQITRDPKAKPDDFADAAYLLGLNLKTQRKALDILLKHYGERKVGLTLEMLKVRDRRYRDLLLEKLESAAEGVKQFNRDAAGRHFRPRRHGRTAADDAFRDRTIEMAWSYLNIARPLLNYFSKDPKVQEISGEHVELLWNSRQAVKDVFVNSGYVGPSRELDKSIRAWLAIALESGHITPSSYQAAQAYANKERLFNRNSRQDLIERCKNLSMAPVSVAEWHVIWPCMDADAFHSRLRLRTASQELFHEYFAKD
ncbi:hypothetical protein KY363_07195, partial [Candidatus Woesearchaeota archaeon]|nr:hypothetical protein [Candidatus Woesearchaeota archaeon]